MKRRTIKKSVSFQSQISESRESSQAQEVFRSKRSIMLVPFHLPLVLYFLFRSGLTEHPFEIMLEGLLVLIMMQTACGYLFSRFDSGIRQCPPSSKKGGDAFVVIISTILSLFFSVVVFVLFILFGAPFHGYLKETFLLSCHVSLITLQPLLIQFKLNFAQLRGIFEEKHSRRSLFRNQIISASMLSVLGCWLGVLPIPLDWDRPWQRWPVTILSGAYVGGFAGSVLALTL